ncbi:ABC transporter permease [Pelagibacterales bacterium SAG-MED31]|nr:ABC transporter permease [Pelagibacterales bacterium SAG-MED31]
MTKSAFLFFKSLGLFFAILVGIGTAVLGWFDSADWMNIVFYSVATSALVLWGWYHFSIRWIHSDLKQNIFSHISSEEERSKDEIAEEQEDSSEKNFFYTTLLPYKWVAIGFLLIITIFIFVSFIFDGFFSGRTLISFLIFLGFIIIASVIGRYIKGQKSTFIGICVLIGLFIIGALTINGFLSLLNLKSMLVFAAFLGLATIGQTLVALLGGLDLSIPFIIGSSNVALMSMISKGVPPWLAALVVLLFGIGVGLINGVLSFRLQGQALILTLGVGFFMVGGVQILVAMNTFSAGTVFGVVPEWMRNLASMNGKTIGLPVPPVILIWIAASILVIVGLRYTKWGRNLYALGGNRLSADRLSISERAYWIGVYVISGFFSAFTGALLLGWSGGGFVGVGDTYLFLTLAAVVVGGTSLLGGWGGYGLSVIGVLILQVLNTTLIGWGLSFEAQQFILGLLIIPMVALYARSPHIRTQV